MHSKPDISSERTDRVCKPVADYCRQYSKIQNQLAVDFDSDIKTDCNDIRIVELFAGVGGFRIGLERASSRYKTVWSNQWEPSTKRQDASTIYCRNFGCEGHSNRDIATVETDSIPEADLLCGGFPCQDYSVATTLKNSAGIEGKKGVLWWQICRILSNCRKKPKYLLLENVDRLLKSPASQRGRDFAIILSSLSDLGYDVEWRVINAADYGMPQRRCRTYMVGYLRSLNLHGNQKNAEKLVLSDGIMAKAFACKARTGKKAKFSSFTIEGDLHEISSGFNSSHPAVSPFLNAGYMSDREVYSIDVDADYAGKRLTLGDILVDEKLVPDEFFISEGNLAKWKYLKGHKSEIRTSSKGYTYNYSEGAMAFPDATDKPSRTIITGEGGPAASRFKHVIVTPSGRHRRLVPVELERLNMFPDNHTEGASDTRRAFLMGNALVTGIVEAIGRELINRIDKHAEITHGYDHTSKEDILRHALLMLGSSLHLQHPEKTTEHRKGKGGMGQAMEEIHFEYTPNSNPSPDFEEAGVELKCTPLKELKDGSYVPKERLVLNIINYMTEAQKDFHTCSFRHKNSCLLLMFYLHEQGVDIYDLFFKIIRLWEYPPEDLKIIMDDWKTIHDKILAGKAHEISEGDTFYLGAVTKGSKAGAEMRPQPFSDIPAPQRAYSLKSAYLGGVLLDTLTRPEFMSGMKITEKQRAKLLKRKADIESIVKSLRDYEEGESFEQLIERRFRPFYGMTVDEIGRSLGVEIALNPKAVGPCTCRAILGVKAAKIAEFEKADIQMKTIRLQPSGALKESMVFDTIDYLELVNEKTWEGSALYSTLTQRFMFVVFKKATSGDEGEATLDRVFFWTMPHADLEIARKVWEDTQSKVKDGIYDDFVKISDDRICHLRPKARNAADLTPNPQGGMSPKKAFWLNRGYIHNIVTDNRKG